MQLRNALRHTQAYNAYTPTIYINMLDMHRVHDACLEHKGSTEF